VIRRLLADSLACRWGRGTRRWFSVVNAPSVVARAVIPRHSAARQRLRLIDTPCARRLRFVDLSAAACAVTRPSDA
jgi:hypothetical protein